MHSDDLQRSLATLFSELVYGAPTTDAFVLNRGDAGLLVSLDHLSATAASASSKGGASIAAHVGHLHYGLSLLNRWAAGENPYEDANWAAAWGRSTVTDAEWQELRRRLRHEVDRWHRTLQSARAWNEAALNNVIGSTIHLAYHLGAIRQIDPGARGPKAND